MRDLRELDKLDDAAVPDAMSSTGPVNGTAMDTLYESPAKTSPRPRDLSAFIVQAYVPDNSATGFQVITGTGKKDGTFSIPDVPGGTYYLLVVAPDDPVPHFFQTASHTIDLGLNVLGRGDTPPATLPTPVTLHLTGMTPTLDTDRVFVDSFSAGAVAVLDFGSTAGLTTFDRVVDWKNVGAPLLDKTRPDDFFVVHTNTAVLDSPRIFTRTIVDFYATQDVTLVDGQPASITGAFTSPAASRNFSFQLDIPGYVQALDVTSRQPVTTVTRVRAGFTGASSQGAPLLDVNSTTSLDFPRLFGGGDYADPYPADWERFLFNQPSILVTYTSRGAPRVVDLIMNTFERRRLAGAFQTISPPIGVPHAIRVAGVDTTQAAAVPFDGVHAVAVEWTAVVGVQRYIVTASQLADDGGNASILPIATFDTTTTSVQMPASLFKVGGSYIVGVSAVVDGSTDYESGSLRRLGFPYARREAVTARLVFASSCGDGTTDAFEECDASGVASALCNADCTTPRCGDAILNAAAGEACDDARDSLTCDTDCTARVCGDGWINRVAQEQCDDGNTRSGDGCDAGCGFVESGFMCTGMPSVCTAPTP